MLPILIIYTGGTIGMEKGADGAYHATSGFEALAKRTISDAIWSKMPTHEYCEILPAIDSSDMSPLQWRLIADVIVDNYDAFSGFIVLHGTDTMAYTASMLSFLLGGLDKTIILTGSQIPLTEPCSDGANNLLVSLQLVRESHVPEVCVYFANRLFRGNRSTKISTSAMIAFESTNYPVLGVFENKLKLFRHRYLASEVPCFELPELTSNQVAVIYLTPGMPASIVRAALSEGVKGLVLVSYGSGNIPVSDSLLMAALRCANEQGVIVVNVSQCAGGHVSSSYAASLPLIEAGVVSGEDMTIEAAVTKLYYLLAKYPHDNHTIKKLLCSNVRGELTPSE